jgi:hypothetical protein
MIERSRSPEVKLSTWFAHNTGWFGPAVAAVLAAVGWYIQLKLRRNRKSGTPAIRQDIRSGRDSTNVQISRIGKDADIDE